MNRFLVAIIAVMVVVCARGFNPELTLPRIGDKCAIQQLSHGPGWCDTSELSPDLRNINILQNMEMSVWCPPSTDTASSLLVLRDREIEHVVLRDDIAYYMKRVRPGMTRDFDSLPLYRCARNGFESRTVVSHGKTNDIGDFSTTGVWLTSIVPGCRMITAHGDTLTNISCITTEIAESLVYENCDTTSYKGTNRMWYAPGYRYPLLSNEAGILLSADGDTLDIVCEWYTINPLDQEESIVDDPVNELIRASEAQRRANERNSDHVLAQKYGKGKQGHTGICNNENNKISISPQIGDESYKEYVLCDISGIVYSCGALSRDGVVISTDGYPNGTYILCITTTGESIVYKFKLNRHE